VNPDTLCTELQREYVAYKQWLADNPKGIHELGRDLAVAVAKPFEEDDPQFVQAVARVYQFVIDRFGDEPRKDGVTPLALHSMYLPRMMQAFGVTDKASYLVALLHDLIEDTDTSFQDLDALDLREAYGPVTQYVLLLTENQDLDEQPRGNAPSLREEAFIEQLRGAPVPVVNTEIVDRLHDLLDLDYLFADGNTNRAWARIHQKVAKCSRIIGAVTQDARGLNDAAFEAFRFRTEQLLTINP
jgi:(p)ppGpp synthase/HD superfamily hydrolase